MKFKPSRHDRPTFGKLANEYGLTYYGTVVPDKSEYIDVSGLTASPDQIDDNYVCGVVAGYEASLLQRSHSIYLPNNSKKLRTWSICQIKLHQSNLPHMYFDGLGKAGGTGSMLISYLRIYEIMPSSIGVPLLEQFKRTFSIYINPDDINALRYILNEEVQSMLAAHFSNIDFELFRDRLIIYSTEKPIQLTTIDKMLRIGVWLARYIDSLHIDK